MSTLTLQAPAKLNLSLRVQKRRSDGFHEIDTLMVKLPGLADEILFEEEGTSGFQCDDPTLDAGDGNLVLRAVRAWEKASAVTCKHPIRLKKTIPLAAGLGGGSSDAATTLLGLERLHENALGMARLCQVASELGSDVPFFLGSGAARCTGRGEKIEAVDAPTPLRVLLLKPGFGVSTADAYGRWDGSRELPGIHYGEQLIHGLGLVNDLERPVFGKHRFLAELKRWLLLRDECEAALLAGSGSTVFAVLREDADADSLARAARHELDPGLWHWSGMTAP